MCASLLPPLTSPQKRSHHDSFDLPVPSHEPTHPDLGNCTACPFECGCLPRRHHHHHHHQPGQASILVFNGAGPMLPGQTLRPAISTAGTGDVMERVVVLRIVSVQLLTESLFSFPTPDPFTLTRISLGDPDLARCWDPERIYCCEIFHVRTRGFSPPPPLLKLERSLFV